MESELAEYFDNTIAPLMVQQKLNVCSTAAHNLAQVAMIAYSLNEMELAKTCMDRCKSLVALIKDEPAAPSELVATSEPAAPAVAP